MILVTGATGQLGRLVIDRLLERVPASQIIAGARSLEKAADIAAKGVAVRVLDYDQPETIPAAFVGVTRALLISGNDFASRCLHHERVIDAAKAANVALLAYTSVLNANPEAMILARDHVTTETYLKASGVPYALLRNGWYNENWLGSLEATLAHGVLLGSAGQGVVTPASRDDFAQAAAVVLTTEGHVGKTYELGGDTGYTLADIAAVFAAVSGKPVVYQDLPEADYAKALEGFGVPAFFAQVLANSDAGIRADILKDTTGDLSRLIGRKTTPLADSVRAALA